MQVESTSASVTSASSPESGSTLPTPFDRDIQELSTWLSAQTRTVYVGDVADIENAFVTIRVSLTMFSNGFHCFKIVLNLVRSWLIL